MANIYNRWWQLKWQLNARPAPFAPASPEFPQLDPYNEKGPFEGLFIGLACSF
jgi:hypothetical protein